MFGDMKAIAKNYNGITRNYDTSMEGVVSELLENKITLARLTTQIDFILTNTNMAKNLDFLKNTGIWEDFVEHQETFDQVQQELDEEYQQDGSTTTSTTQEHETKQDGERKKLPEHEYEDGEKTTEQESRSNNRHGTATVTPHLHTAPMARQTEITTESSHPHKNTDSIDPTTPPKCIPTRFLGQHKHTKRKPKHTRLTNSIPPPTTPTTSNTSRIIYTRILPTRSHSFAPIPPINKGRTRKRV
jgi:acetyl/propionyl-CoA carboxylase alpha subunit